MGRRLRLRSLFTVQVSMVVHSAQPAGRCAGFSATPSNLVHDRMESHHGNASTSSHLYAQLERK